jgi:hypothetical protein
MNAGNQSSAKGLNPLGLPSRKPTTWADVAQWRRVRISKAPLQEKLTFGEKVSHFLEDSFISLQNVVRKNPVTSKPAYEYADQVMAINRRYGKNEGWSNEDEDLGKFFVENEINLDFYGRAAKALKSRRFGVHHHPAEVL